MSPRLLSICMDGVTREMIVRTQGVGAAMTLDDKVWWMPTCLYADYTVLFGENKQKLQRMINESDKVCYRRKLKVNQISKVMVF